MKRSGVAVDGAGDVRWSHLFLVGGGFEDFLAHSRRIEKEKNRMMRVLGLNSEEIVEGRCRGKVLELLIVLLSSLCI